MATVNQPSLLPPTNKLTAAMIGLAGAEIVTRWLDAKAVILAGPNVDAVIYAAAPFVIAFDDSNPRMGFTPDLVRARRADRCRWFPLDRPHGGRKRL